ncbi:MAG: NFACT RNA binding domain-containing protein [Candidatus Diapherotrites archaeon]|nr:NFACT RNA binding domain-containing protein [Candidatus Diapherotrites archaeon]
MVQVEIDFSKSLEENASLYFDRGKEAKAKAVRISAAIAETEKRLSKESKKAEEAKPELFRKRAKEWFEKFRWFYSSDGFLVIGGRDAQSNEIIVKKHMEKGDLYFHADIVGAPHCVVKAAGGKVPEKTKEEAAVFAAVFSKAWNAGVSNADVYSVNPEQVSKKAPTGESIGTGAFMIYGERQWFRKLPVRIAVGIDKEGRVIAGPESAVKKHSAFAIVLLPGQEKKSEIAKKLKNITEKKYGAQGIHIDEFLAVIPSGESQIWGNP